MKNALETSPGIAKVCVCLCTLLVLGACRWMSPQSPGQDWELTQSQRDSLKIYLKSYRQTAADNKRLKAQNESQSLDIAKLRAECEHQTARNELLEEELEHLKNDLDQVEKQFIFFEKRLQVKETKASAVAAIAEVQLLFDKLRKESPHPLHPNVVAEVNEKIRASDDLVKNQNYAAAVYYANRAMRILNQTERLNNVTYSDGTPRIVSVFKANVRKGPGSKFDVIDKVSYGAVVVQLDVSDNWCKVRTKSGKSGWIHVSLIR